MAASDSDHKLEQSESLNYILGLSLTREGKTRRRSMWVLYQKVCASEFKITSPATVVPGLCSHFGDNEELERNPHHCVGLDKGSDSSP